MWVVGSGPGPWIIAFVGSSSFRILVVLRRTWINLTDGTSYRWAVACRDSGRWIGPRNFGSRFPVRFRVSRLGILVSTITVVARFSFVGRKEAPLGRWALVWIVTVCFRVNHNRRLFCVWGTNVRFRAVPQRAQQGRGRHPNDFKVQTQGPVLDIKQIQPNPVFHVLFGAGLPSVAHGLG